MFWYHLVVLLLLLSISMQPSVVNRKRSRSGTYAFSIGPTTKGGVNYYFKPQEVPVYDKDGNVKWYTKTIVAVPDKSPANYYFFTIHPTPYPKVINNKEEGTEQIEC